MACVEKMSIAVQCIYKIWQELHYASNNLEHPNGCGH